MAGYAVKEIFYSLQGEGAHSGRAAIFCRFAGCNLWSGRERDRAQAVCAFCDTAFVGTDGLLGGKYRDAASLANQIAQLWPLTDRSRGWVVCTGGEPLLQLDGALLNALHAQSLAVALETNGTQPLPATLDWVCVSPKVGATLVLTQGDELKLVYPQPGLNPADYLGLDFQHFFLQPQAVPNDALQTQENIRASVAYCLAHPDWRLSVQSHKWLGIA